MHRVGQHTGKSGDPGQPFGERGCRCVEEARAAVREQIGHGADWIKLFSTGDYFFTTAGEAEYKLTCPMTVLQQLIDETHLLGKKAVCHVFGGEGQKNTIIRR